MSSHYQINEERTNQLNIHNNSRESHQLERRNRTHPFNSMVLDLTWESSEKKESSASSINNVNLNFEGQNERCSFHPVFKDSVNDPDRQKKHFGSGKLNFLVSQNGPSRGANLNERRKSLPFGDNGAQDHYRLVRLDTHLHLPGLGDLHSPELAQPKLPNFLLSGDYDSPDLEHSIYADLEKNPLGGHIWKENSSLYHSSGQMNISSNFPSSKGLGIGVREHNLDGQISPWYMERTHPTNADLNRRFSFRVENQLELENQANQILSMLYSKTPSHELNQEQSFYPGNSFRQTEYDQNRRFLFDKYFSEDVLAEGLQLGSILKGNLRINKRNRYDAYVTTEELDQDVYIYGGRLRNRGLEGDTVAITLLDQQKVLEIRQQRNRDAEKRGRKIKPAETVESDTEPKYYGQVVAILQRGGGNVYSGTLMLNRPNSKFQDSDEQGNGTRDNLKPIQRRPRIIWFKPSDKRLPLMVIPIDEAPHNFMEEHIEYTNKIFLVSIKRWPPTTLHPFATLVGELGKIGNIEAETTAILADCDITAENFDESIQSCLPVMPWSIPASEYQSRKDLREDRIFTIDPSTAKDLDDAVSCKRLDDGNYLIGTHVADASYFVRPGTPLDREARRRATSVYLIQKVIPMLPPVLSEELCSLNPGVDRLAFSVMWKMTPDARIVDMWCGRTVIKSCGKLSYEAAQNVIEGNHLDPEINICGQSREEVEKDILIFHKLSLVLRKMRFDNGALSIDSIRLAFELDQCSAPTSCSIYKSQDSNRLIEEFMLLANITVAQLISSAYPEQALLRRHASPIERRMNEFVKSARGLGYQIDSENSATLQRSLAGIEPQEAQQIMKLLCIKPMQRAKYFCTGFLDEVDFKHFALNIPYYTHFTSPIRRYADIIVHRTLLQALVGNPRFFLSKEEVQKVAIQCNIKKDNAKAAQEMSSQLYLSYYLNSIMEKQGSIECDAVVVDIHENSFDVLVPKYGLEKRIHLEKLPLQKAVFKSEEVKTLSLYWNINQGSPSDERKAEVEVEELTEDYEELLTDDSEELDLQTLREKCREDDPEACPSMPRSYSNDSLSEISCSPISSKSDKIPFTGNESVSSYSCSPKSIVLEDPDICKNGLGLLDHIMTSKYEEGCQQILRIFDHIQVNITVDNKRSPAMIGVVMKNPYH